MHQYCQVCGHQGLPAIALQQPRAPSQACAKLQSINRSTTDSSSKVSRPCLRIYEAAADEGAIAAALEQQKL